MRRITMSHLQQTLLRLCSFARDLSRAKPQRRKRENQEDPREAGIPAIPCTSAEFCLSAGVLEARTALVFALAAAAREHETQAALDSSLPARNPRTAGPKFML